MRISRQRKSDATKPHEKASLCKLGVFELPHQNLAHDRGILDLAILGEEERFAENDRQHAVALEWQKNCRPLAGRWLGDDAEVLIVRRHQDVAAAQVNLVGPQVAADDRGTYRPNEQRSAIFRRGQRCVRGRALRVCAVADSSPKE